MTVTVHALPNGMSVLLEENHTRPVISFNALIKVGSASETDREAGMCHLIEHMLFKGTPHYAVGEIARSVEAAGGEINAYTSFDQTVYYINMASRFADKGLAILADAVMHPLIDAEELAREKEVILEEIRREKDHPARMVSEELFKVSYTRHPYGRPIIGFPETVKGFTRDEVLEFFKRWYTPHNIVFIVVGDFDSQTMLDKLRNEFAPFVGAPPPASLADELKEPTQDKPRLIIKKANIQSVHMALAWHIPRITHYDVPALDITSHILGGSDSSRLEQEVKEKQRLVHNIAAYAYTPKDPGLLAVSAIMSDAQAPKALASIFDEVCRFHDEPAQAGELARAKLNIRSAEIYEKETVGGQGGKLAYYLATTGSHEFEERYFQMLQDVQAARVRDVAREYCARAKATAVFLVPNDSRLASKERELMRIIERPCTPARRKKAAAKDVRTMRLANGVTLIVKEQHTLPIVAVCAAVPGGLRVETPVVNGIANLAAHTLTKGTTSRSAVQIAKGIEKIAGHLEGFSARNTCGVKGEFLSDHLREGFELFGDVLTHPAWTPREVSSEKQFILQAIRDQEDALGTMAFVHFLKALYPKHPYGLRMIGTTASIKSITPQALDRFYRRVYRAGAMVLAVVGDVNPDEVASFAQEYLRDLPRGRTPKLRIAVDPRPKAPVKVINYKDEKQQAHVVMGFQGTRISSPDRYAFTVLNNILAGQGGRLFLELRDKMGLAYVVSSTNQEGVEPGYFTVYMGTEPAKIDTAIDGIRTELGHVIKDQVSGDELERAKQYIVGSYELDSQRNSALASTYALNVLYDLGIEEVERYPKKILAVTAQDVHAVARKYLTLQAPVISIIMPK